MLFTSSVLPWLNLVKSFHPSIISLHFDVFSHSFFFFFFFYTTRILSSDQGCACHLLSRLLDKWLLRSLSLIATIAITNNTNNINK